MKDTIVQDMRPGNTAFVDTTCFASIQWLLNFSIETFFFYSSQNTSEQSRVSHHRQYISVSYRQRKVLSFYFDFSRWFRRLIVDCSFNCELFTQVDEISN